MLIRALQAAAGNFGVTGYAIDNSLRFNDNDSAYLSRTPSVAGNRKTFTFSAWIKRGNIGGSQLIFSCRPTSSPYTQFQCSSDSLSFIDSGGTSITTSQVFRDVSGWYHIIIAIDTTQATANNRFKLYVNGSQVTLFSSATYPLQNADLNVNTASTHAIGSLGSFFNSNYFDGYMAEVNFIDGQALTPDDFGQIDATTGEWSPIAYEGTYGTNGFYLPFNGNANDSSGNGNNWTENNLASTDYMVDTPTNNFCTLNPLADNFATYSQGNLSIVCGTTGNGWTFSTMALPPTGKWYVEAVWTGTPSDFMGFNSPSLVRVIQTRGQSGQIWADNVLVETVTAWSAGQIVGLQVDCDAGTFQFYRDNVAFGSSHSFTHIDGMSFGARDGSTAASTSFNMNFGADSSFAGLKTRQGNTDANGIGDFYYTPPTGYLALCTDNLPAPAIEQPETQFNVVTYTGNSADRNIDVGFEADFVWVKSRSSALDHALFDRVRGNNLWLFSSSTSAEYVADNGISFDYANGFNIDNGANSDYYNTSGNSYVAWCWKAGGTAVTNTDGTITSQVSANVDAGFSIVGYTGNGSSGATVGHGLSSALDMIIVKDRDNAYSWQVYHSFNTSAPETDYLILNLSNVTADSADRWSDTAPTSSVFTLGNNAQVNGSGDNLIAYCFHSVEGFSKFGSYVGNGSADGPFVYTGFKPAFVMIKCTTVTNHWVMKDNLRAADYNPSSGNLYANLNFAEDTTASVNVDLLANGFKIKGNYGGINASGANFIYIAFAEHPFNYSTGR